eukprot:GEMP01053778.1.p2 GENE.GEMP01053778.1~~GEMP01053778.1.p2  ORF type:complete len:157 (+),score=27.22 GEMP01053778.1:92-562(+)
MVSHSLVHQPLIFQDVDGVLNTMGSGVALDDKLVSNLVHLTNESKAQIVLSTAWRKHDFLVQQLISKLRHAGLDISNQDFTKTPSLCRGVSCRPDEIESWLQAHPGHSNRWVAIDDWDLTKMEHGSFLKGHFVNTDPRVGLTGAKADEALAFLHQA